MKIEGRIKQVEVHTPAGLSGRLHKNARFTFNYRSGATLENQVSITMELRNESYTRGALFPVFEMNLPEGYVRRYVIERLRKNATVDDMMFLALSGDNGIGRLSYKSEIVDDDAIVPITLGSILAADKSNEYFSELVEKYLLTTTVGVSGVQPKVVVPEERGTLTLPSLIVKSGNAEYPHIAINEFICMSIAKEAGLRTPEFWVTEDKQLFVMRRFDIMETGDKLGMEDFSVLMGKSGDRKYEGRYESLMRAANLYEIDVTEMFEQIALSLIVGNGDAHLKNFAILYDDIEGPYRLSPIFDVVCTKPYGDESTALSINKSHRYPSRAYLEKMGTKFGVKKPGNILDRVSEAIAKICAEYSDDISQPGAQNISKEILRNRDLVMVGKK